MTSISSNFSSAQHLTTATNGANKAISRLSSGTKINSAKDDVAGLAISNRMNSEIQGLNQAMRNANDGISMAQTADGALSESTNIMQRMRDLSVQASNSSYNDQDRAAMNSEFTQLREELGRIAETTTFNDKELLNGNLESGTSFQVGANANQTIDVSIPGADPSDLGINSLSLLTAEDAQNSITALDDAIGSLSETRGELSAVQNRFESAIENLGNASENSAAAKSRIADADIAGEVSNLLKNKILQQAGVAMQAQAKQSAGLTLALLS
jgi:flagellin